MIRGIPFEPPSIRYSATAKETSGPGSLDLGLLRYDSERMVFAPHLKGKDRARLGSEFVWPITEDPGGRLWVGAVNGGLASLGLGRTSIVLRAAGPEGPKSTPSSASSSIPAGRCGWERREVA